jgi:hypothetical protein
LISSNSSRVRSLSCSKRRNYAAIIAAPSSTKNEDKALGPRWHVAMQPGKRKQLDPTREWARLLERAEQLKASVRAEGRASVPCNQEPDQAQEGSLHGLGQERGAAVQPVRAGQPRHCQETAVGTACPRYVLSAEGGLKRGFKHRRTTWRGVVPRVLDVATTSPRFNSGRDVPTHCSAHVAKQSTSTIPLVTVATANPEQGLEADVSRAKALD